MDSVWSSTPDEVRTAECGRERGVGVGGGGGGGDGGAIRHLYPAEFGRDELLKKIKNKQTHLKHI